MSLSLDGLLFMPPVFPVLPPAFPPLAQQADLFSAFRVDIFLSGTSPSRGLGAFSAGLSTLLSPPDGLPPISSVAGDLPFSKTLAATLGCSFFVLETLLVPDPTMSSPEPSARIYLPPPPPLQLRTETSIMLPAPF